MEQLNHLRSTLETKMDITDENHMDEMKMEIETNQTVDNDFSAGLYDETHKQLTISERPFSSCRKVRVRSRPTLQSTKSFPPYSQCIGGLGGDEEQDNVLNSEFSTTQDPSLINNDMMRDDGNEVVHGTERKEDFEMNARCTRNDMKAKWRMRRRERLGDGYKVDPDGWESARWSGKRRVEETERERKHDDKQREGGTNGERKHCKGRNLSLEIERKEEVKDEELKRSPNSAAEGENKGRRKTPRDEEAEELPGIREIPHPILSKLLYSSSSTSSCSSINLSSAESDEVFSEGEDAGSKRRTFRKCRSWKTYLTMMHWSLRRQSSWIQLAGHQGNFQLSDGGEVLKLYSEVEAKCLDSLMRDQLKPFVPQYHGLVTRGEDRYIRLEDLLSGLRKPVIMDCKMGVRTYQEEELTKARVKEVLRSDMYQKMVKIDPSAPSAEEHAQKAVTKWRYLQWRDTTSSTSTLGFRIEGIMMEDGSIQRDFGKIRTSAQVTEALLYFTRSQRDILKAYHTRLLALNDALKNSQFFGTHEVIGSSLLFVHDHSSKANVWMIDFGKTTPVPNTSKLLHNIPWAEGSREDGYLIGLTSLITSLSQAINVASWQQEDSCGEETSVKYTEGCG
ncbi:inositol-trisphosphate 3-kinase B-like [Larimichthys crocea]|uniref:inositol-trisphosphate 3-kinase B-like n=1 Tax=Larimichthys crocea TaxID=215358 RepID=UPI000F5F201F|nr:inositol-trisphosphate 3-kinase B-like [Larimichthys crocea]